MKQRKWYTIPNTGKPAGSVAHVIEDTALGAGSTWTAPIASVYERRALNLIAVAPDLRHHLHTLMDKRAWLDVVRDGGSNLYRCSLCNAVVYSPVELPEMDHHPDCTIPRIEDLLRWLASAAPDLSRDGLYMPHPEAPLCS